MFRLESWLLNFAYATLILIASPWIVWSAIRHGKYREGFGEKFLGRVPLRVDSRTCIWLHAVSVGEVNLLQTTLNELRTRLPNAEFVISTTTKTGYDLACKKYADQTVFYCPLDFSWAVRNAWQRVRPDMLVLAELELWPNLIRLANQRGTKVTIINGRLSDNSFRGYRRFRPLVSRLLNHIDLVAAQNEETAARFLALGAKDVQVSGSLKFDGAVTDRQNERTQALCELAGFDPDDVVFLAGSTQAPEEKYALEIFQRLSQQHPTLRLVLVPRHPERFDEVAHLLDESGEVWTRRSSLITPPSALHPPPSVLLVDTIGELGAWWGTASLGLVGGSFGSRGGQNMLEPATYGVATCFGPNTKNFRDIVAQLLAVDGAKVVQDQTEFEEFVVRALDDPNWATAMGSRAQNLVLSQQGATQRTVDLLLPLVSSHQSQVTKTQAA